MEILAQLLVGNNKCIISWFINFSCQYFCQGYEYVISSFLLSQIMQAVVEESLSRGASR